MKRLKRSKYGLTENPIGLQVSFHYAGRQYLGDVLDSYYDQVTGSIRLKVRHFNGEMWPLDPPALNVEVLQ